MAETPKTPLEQPRCHSDRFNGSDFTLGRFDHKSQMGVTKDHLLTPEYWTHVSELMSPYSEITVRCDDGTYYAKFLVLDCGRGWAKVQLLGWWDLTSNDVAISQSSAGNRSLYDIQWKGPNRKHVILRIADQQVLHEGEQRKESAELWLREFLAGKARKAVTAEQPG